MIRPYSSLSTAFETGGPLVFRRELLAAQARLKQLSGVAIAGYEPRQTPTGIAFSGGAEAEASWQIALAGTGSYSVGTGCVMVAGVADPFILSSAGIAAVSAGYIVVKAVLRPKVETGSYASSLNNGFSGEVEVDEDPHLAFLSEGAAPGGTHCAPDFSVPECDYGTIQVPLAFVDEAAGRVVPFIRRGLLIGFMGTRATSWMGADFRVSQV